MQTAILYYTNNTKPNAIQTAILNRFKERRSARGWLLICVGDKRVTGVDKYLKFDSTGMPMEQSIFGKIKAGCEYIRYNYGSDVRVFLADDDVVHPDRHYLECPDVWQLAYNLNFVYASKCGLFETCGRGSLTNGGLSGPVDLLLKAANDKLENFNGVWEPTEGATNYRSSVPCIDLRGPWNNTWSATVEDGEIVASNQPAKWADDSNPLIDWALDVCKQAHVELDTPKKPRRTRKTHKKGTK